MQFVSDVAFLLFNLSQLPHHVKSSQMLFGMCVTQMLCVSVSAYIYYQREKPKVRVCEMEGSVLTSSQGVFTFW